jgi:hypothetical protein
MTLAISTLILIGLFATCVVGIQKNKRRPSQFLIPAGYVGWVRIEFEVKDAPAVPIEEGHYVFRLPPTGRLRTSTKMETGWASDHYFYYSVGRKTELPVTGRGQGGLIWAGSIGQSEAGGVVRRYEEFFVGTEEQLRAAAQRQD